MTEPRRQTLQAQVSPEGGPQASQGPTRISSTTEEETLPGPAAVPGDALWEGSGRVDACTPTQAWQIVQHKRKAGELAGPGSGPKVARQLEAQTVCLLSTQCVNEVRQLEAQKVCPMSTCCLGIMDARRKPLGPEGVIFVSLMCVDEVLSLAEKPGLRVSISRPKPERRELKHLDIVFLCSVSEWNQPAARPLVHQTFKVFSRTLTCTPYCV